MAAHLACNTKRAKTVCFVGESEHFAKKLSVHEMGSWVGGIFNRRTCFCYLHVFYDYLLRSPVGGKVNSKP